MNRRWDGTAIQLILAHSDLPWMMAVAGDLALHPRVKVTGFAQNGQQTLERVVAMAPDALLIHQGLAPGELEGLLRQLQEKSPHTRVFLLAGGLPTQWVLNAKAMGVAEILPTEGMAVAEWVNRIIACVDAFRREQSCNSGTAGIPAAPERPGQDSRQRPVTQSVILTHSPKGGVGKSTLAVNLAAAIKHSPVYRGMRVALLDFDTDFGNLSTLCNLPKHMVWSRNISLWEHAREDMTLQEVEELMIPTAGGVLVCPAPLIPGAAERFTMEAADRMLRILRRYFGVIIIDGGPKVNAVVDAAMHHATHVLMVATPEGQAAENLSRIVQFLSPDPHFPEKPDMGHLLKKTYLVVNRVQRRRGDLSSGEVAQIVGRPVIAEIPEDEAVASALHGAGGRQAVEAFADSAFALAMKRLANDLTGAYPKGGGKGGTAAMFRTLGKLLRREG